MIELQVISIMLGVVIVAWLIMIWLVRGLNKEIDPMETLKLVIKKFEEAPSVGEGLYDAQELIFERHPELEE